MTDERANVECPMFVKRVARPDKRLDGDLLTNATRLAVYHLENTKNKNI